MQKLIELLGENEKVFVELTNNNLKAKFMQQAEDEGFVVNGDFPTNHKAESVMIIHKDYTVIYLHGFVANMQFQTYPKDMRIRYHCN